MNIFELNHLDKTLLDLALTEDLGTPFCDITTTTLFADSTKTCHAKIISKEKKPLVICGISIVDALLKKIDRTTELKTNYQDGQCLSPQETLLTIHGNANTILMLERTLLNFLRHLSAIATLTKQFVDKVSHTPLKILDTRKTTPGFRHLEKYAVHCGGGINHRMGLYDAILIKDTHVDFLGGLENALKKIPNKNPLPVIVEIRNQQEFDIAIQYPQKITRLLFDNMLPEQLAQYVKKTPKMLETESSGNITLNNITDVAQTGVNYASIGCITYAAGQVDLSMMVE